MSKQDKRQNAPDSSGEGQHPPEEESEYEEGRQEVLEEAGEHRIMEEKEAAEERVREDELRHGHAHTPYFGYDNPSYEDKDAFAIGSPEDKKKHKQKK